MNKVEKFICTILFLKCKTKKQRNKEQTTTNCKTPSSFVALFPLRHRATVRWKDGVTAAVTPTHPQQWRAVLRALEVPSEQAASGLEGYLFSWSPRCFSFSYRGLQPRLLGRRHAALGESLLSDWPLIYVSTTMTHNKDRKNEGIERGKWFQRKLKKLCPCCKNPSYASWSRSTLASRYNGTKLRKRR